MMLKRDTMWQTVAARIQRGPRCARRIQTPPASATRPPPQQWQPWVPAARTTTMRIMRTTLATKKSALATMLFARFLPSSSPSSPHRPSPIAHHPSPHRLFLASPPARPATQAITTRIIQTTLATKKSALATMLFGLFLPSPSPSSPIGWPLLLRQPAQFRICVAHLRIQAWPKAMRNSGAIKNAPGVASE